METKRAHIHHYRSKLLQSCPSLSAIYVSEWCTAGIKLLSATDNLCRLSKLKRDSWVPYYLFTSFSFLHNSGILLFLSRTLFAVAWFLDCCCLSIKIELARRGFTSINLQSYGEMLLTAWNSSKREIFMKNKKKSHVRTRIDIYPCRVYR